MSGQNSRAGDEFFNYSERDNGDQSLVFGQIGGDEHGHAVLDENGNVKFLRETDGRIVADDKYDDRGW